MRIKTVEIDAEVEAVLRAAFLCGTRLTLSGNLDRALYVKTNKVLELLGYKWNRAARCHIADVDTTDKLRAALETGSVVDEQKTYQFFETPADVADQLVALAGIQAHHKVLEPSAGKGALVAAITRTGASPAVVDVCELHHGMREELKADNSVCVVGADFMVFQGKYDRIVMNPPFANGQDIEHIRHAYDLLLPGGVVAAISSPSWQFNTAKKYAAFREWYAELQDEGWASEPVELEEGTFKASGTNVRALMFRLVKPRE